MMILVFTCLRTMFTDLASHFDPPHDPSRVTGGERVGRHILSHHRSGPDHRPLTDRHPRQDAGVEANPGVRPDPDRLSISRAIADPWPPSGNRSEFVSPSGRINWEAVGIH